jgi:histidyl-tRNA synthetase
MGDVVLQALLEDKKELPKLENDLDYYIVLVNEEMFSTGVKIAEKLRENNRVELDLTERNLGKQLNYANSKNAKKVIIIGPNELKKNKVRIRDMKTGKESLKEISKLK